MHTHANPANRTTASVVPERAGVRISVLSVLGAVPTLTGVWWPFPAAPIASGSDTFVVHDGNIAVQTSAAKVDPKSSPPPRRRRAALAVS
jgi:hypothetical protein